MDKNKWNKIKLAIKHFLIGYIEWSFISRLLIGENK